MSVNKENGKTSKLDSSIELIKKIKFVVLFIISAAVVSIAVVSGDGDKIISELYEKVTGVKHEVFVPVSDTSAEPYQILKYKLSRNSGSTFEDADITIYSKSETSYKYRVEVNGDYSIYKINKDAKGIWKILKQ